MQIDNPARGGVAGDPPEEEHISQKMHESAEAIGVVIAVSEPLLGRALAECLVKAAGIEIVGVTRSAADCYRVMDDVAPDVALVSTSLPDAPGLAAAEEVRRRFRSASVIVISARETDDELLAAIRAGAAAYCGFGVEEREIVALVRRVATGEFVINEQVISRPDVAARILDQFRSIGSIEPVRTTPFAPLTERELQILRRVSAGNSNQEIAQGLGISAQTVKNHVTSILRKLAVNDRTRAVVIALQNGWISLDGQPSLPGDPGDGTGPSPDPNPRS